MNMTSLIGMLWGAGGPDRLPLRSTWTVHETVHAVLTDAKANALDDEFPCLQVHADPDVMTAVGGVVESLYSLIGSGAVSVLGQGWDAALVAFPGPLRGYRRQL